MTVAYGPGAAQRIGFRQLRARGWEVFLAAVGDGSARPLLRVEPVTIRLSEGERVQRAAEAAVVHRPLVEAALAQDGTLRVRCHQAPPVLVIQARTGPVTPLTGDDGSTAVVLAPGGVIFACSPSLLDALDPAEVMAAPTLLWTSPDPPTLLHRWVSAAERQGIRGAAAMVARRGRPRPRRP